VTCPTIRIHPAIIAQAAATAAALMPGRFFLGVGTGENLNEHIFGDAWPSPPVRLEMLEEAIDVIRTMWQGGLQYHRGRYFTVDGAQLYTLPEQRPALMCAASGPEAAKLAGTKADGLIGTSPDAELIQGFREAGGGDKPRIAQLAVCWAKTAEEARKTVLEIWPNAALGGNLGQELPLPRDYEAAVKTVREEDIESQVPCGPDPRPFIEQIEQYVEAGFDHVYLHQVGHDQAGFIKFYKDEIEPHFARQSEGAERLALAS
jgi:G6PDH family F420-dependent oxidoreductase